MCTDRETLVSERDRAAEDRDVYRQLGIAAPVLAAVFFIGTLVTMPHNAGQLSAEYTNSMYTATGILQVAANIGSYLLLLSAHELAQKVSELESEISWIDFMASPVSNVTMVQ